MKSRIIWLAVVFTAMAGFYYTTIRPAMTPVPSRFNKRITQEFQAPDLAMPPIPAPRVDMPIIALPPLRLPPVIVSERRERPTANSPEVPIQDGATIDFSIGAPVVRSQAGDQAAMDKALREMNAAVKDITFDPPEKK
jgi:hypothetical protein